MPIRDPNFRPDQARSVYVFGQIDDTLLSRIVPNIIRLRAENDKPITVFINSPGGSIRALEVLSGCLNDTDIEGNGCRIITVASGDAASAAATLLSLGNYAYAHERSVIHFHGARYFEVETVTTESASTYAASLAERNRQIAFDLANAVIRRLVQRYSIVRGEFDEIRKRNEEKNLSELECFVNAISSKLDWRASEVVGESLKKTKVAMHLSNTIVDSLEVTEDTTPLQQDAQVLKAVVDHKLNQDHASNWRLNEDGCSMVVSDYLLLRDYRLGTHRRSLKWICKNLGLSFLSAGEFEEFETLEKESAEKAEIWLSEKVMRQLEPFWYFTVCLCRQLQEGENRLSSSEAYWLGAVDEVIGTKMQGYRAIMEADQSEGNELIPKPASSSEH